MKSTDVSSLLSLKRLLVGGRLPIDWSFQLESTLCWNVLALLLSSLYLSWIQLPKVRSGRSQTLGANPINADTSLGLE